MIYYFKYVMSGTKNSFFYIIKPKIESTERDIIILCGAVIIFFILSVVKMEEK